MKKLVFKSNTEGKIKKLLNGSIFASNVTFITELFQNSQRALAKNVRITQDKNIFTFEDDGVGLKNPEGLMTFDYSEWESTDEGFGIGFWSVLAIDNLEKIMIESNKYLITCDVSLLRDVVNGGSSNTLEDVLSLTIMDNVKKGFKVTLISDFFYDSILNEIEENCKYLNFEVSYNGDYLEKIDLFDEVYGDFVDEFNTRLFSAKLSVSNYCNYPEVYYENRKVCDLYSFPYVEGVIKIKSKAVTLREPDRTEIIYDNKRYVFMEKLQETVKKLYKSFLDNSNCSDILDTYEDGITRYLSVSDFEKYLKIDDIDIVEEVDKDEFEDSLNKFSFNIKCDEKVDEELADDIVEESENEINLEEPSNDMEEVVCENNLTINKTNKNNNSSSIFKNIEEISQGDKNDVFNSEDYKNDNNEDTTRTSVRSLLIDSEISSNQPNKSLKDFIKKNKSVVWVEARHREHYKENIALAEYYGVKVLIAKNSLLEQYFKEKNIDYITSLKDKVIIEMTYKDITTKTDKEVTFLKLLEPVRKALNLPEGFFKIANISKVTTINLNDKTKLLKEKNSKDKINTYAVSNSREIIFDRTAIGLKNFNLVSSKNVSIGKNELKCLMYNMDTIAHELAHVLYNTTDNTSEHFFAQSKIQEELVKLYMRY